MPLHFVRSFRLSGLLLSTLLVAGTAHAAVHNVSVGPGLSFSPSDITIAQGDTVNWIWLGGNHSVTSGTSPADPNVGVEFDSGVRFNPPGPFSQTFNTAGDFPYFCSPHFGVGMTGVVHVTAALVPSMGTWALFTTALLVASAGSWTLLAHRRRPCRQPNT